MDVKTVDETKRVDDLNLQTKPIKSIWNTFNMNLIRFQVYFYLFVHFLQFSAEDWSERPERDFQTW